MLVPAPWTINNLTLADLDVADGVPIYSASAAGPRRVTVDRLLGLGLHALCEGRLTTETGVPFSTSDRTAQATLYFTPSRGNRIALYDGSRWKLYTFSEQSLVLAGLTAGKNYDAFLFALSATTFSLHLEPWTNDTTRASSVVYQGGICGTSLNSTFRYLGTIRTTSATTTEDSETRRFVWNYAQQRPQKLKKIDTTASWNGGTGSAYTALNGSMANRVEFVRGLNEEPVCLEHLLLHSVSGTGGTANCGIGLDSTTTTASDLHPGSNSSPSVLTLALAKYRGLPAAGYHYLQLLQYANSANATTFYGSIGNSALFQGGALGTVVG